MKRMCKTKLSLAIALTIASSVGQYAMAEYPVFSLTKGETVDLRVHILLLQMVGNLVSVT